MLCDTPRLLLVVGGFYGWFTVGWCVCRGWCVRVSHVFEGGSPKVPDFMRHTSPFTGGWWFLSMVGLRLDGVFVVAGVFVSLTSSELVARRCMMLCDTPRLLLVVGGFYSWFKFNLAMCLYWGVVFLLVMGSATMQRLIFSQIFQGGGCFPSVSTGCLLFKKAKATPGGPTFGQKCSWQSVEVLLCHLSDQLSVYEFLWVTTHHIYIYI